MDDDQSLSTTTIERFARQLGIETTSERREQIRTEIAHGVHGYDALTQTIADWAPAMVREPPAVTFDPGPDDDPYNAFISTFELKDGTGPLSDLTVGVKDNIAIGGVRMTCGSEVFTTAVPNRDAAVVTRLLDAGASIVGKTNMDELAYGPTGETSAFGRTENPAAPGRVTGGSSSGSAAAVASGAVDVALGTDTGGSVRIPSSFCNLVGFKPTWGTVPQAGVVELAYTLDHVGPIARDVHTVARIMDVLSPLTPAENTNAESYVRAVASPPAVESLTLGVPTEFDGDYVSETVRHTIREQLAALEAAGATVRDVSVPLIEGAVSAWNAIVNVEFATFLESAATPLFRRESVDEAWHRAAAAGIANDARQFGNVVQRKAIEGKYLVQERDADHYVAARNYCNALAAQFADALTDYDALVTPTMATEPIEAGTWSPHSYSAGGADAAPPLAVNTRPANLAGIPAVTLPIDGDDSRPIGIQFLGDLHEDADVLAVAAAVERFRDRE